MGRFDGIVQIRRSRVIAVGVAVALLSATVAGIAWAKNEVEGDKFDVAATRYIRLLGNEGEQGVTVELLDIGGVVLSANCGGGPGWWDPENPYSDPGYPYGWSIFGGSGFQNNSSRPVLVVTVPPLGLNLEGQAAEPSQTNLDPGEGDPVFFVGQWINEGTGAEEGSVWTFAVLGYGGTSVTGTFAASARVNPGDPNVDGDEFGECVFSAQAKG